MENPLSDSLLKLGLLVVLLIMLSAFSLAFAAVVHSWCFDFCDCSFHGHEMPLSMNRKRPFSSVMK
jgi:hypothetical protein